ncbi:hypothetical protein TSMEX_009710 [Taenia solium]|eukprot:TsM_000265400 transcript=TsM_000265400 gene=TsM_000265400
MSGEESKGGEWFEDESGGVAKSNGEGSGALESGVGICGRSVALMKALKERREEEEEEEEEEE